MEESGQIGHFGPQKGDVNAFKKQQIISSLALGAKVAPACRAARVGRSTFYEWYNKDPEFAAAIDAAEWDSIDKVEGYLEQACSALDITAIIFYLCNRDPNRWQRQPKPKTDDMVEKARALQEIFFQMDEVTAHAQHLLTAPMDSDTRAGDTTSERGET